MIRAAGSKHAYAKIVRSYIPGCVTNPDAEYYSLAPQGRVTSGRGLPVVKHGHKYRDTGDRASPINGHCVDKARTSNKKERNLGGVARS